MTLAQRGPHFKDKTQSIVLQPLGPEKVALLGHHVVDFGHPAAEGLGVHVPLHGLHRVVDDAAVFHLKLD